MINLSFLTLIFMELTIHTEHVKGSNNEKMHINTSLDYYECRGGEHIT